MYLLGSCHRNMFILQKLSDEEALEKLEEGENRTKGRHVKSLIFEELSLGGINLS